MGPPNRHGGLESKDEPALWRNLDQAAKMGKKGREIAERKFCPKLLRRRGRRLPEETRPMSNHEREEKTLLQRSDPNLRGALDDLRRCLNAL